MMPSNEGASREPDLTMTIVALYKFVLLEDFKTLRQPLWEICRDHGIMGTVLLAREGINGTIAGSEEGVQSVLAWLRQDPRLADLEAKASHANHKPFYRMKVRLKKEIVTMGVEDLDPNLTRGTYVAPEDWNLLIADPEVTLIDTRNEYEVQVGTFQGAVDPHTRSFREFPDYVEAHLDPVKHPKVAMFCTGGIRCEKATAYLKSKGFSEVYHLKGGILKYLETVPESGSLWRGECFVFDQRVSVDHQLQPGHYELCHACRHPLTPEDRKSETYREGVSCPYCQGTFSEEKLRSLEERQKQTELARQRGDQHIGKNLTR